MEHKFLRSYSNKYKNNSENFSKPPLSKAINFKILKMKHIAFKEENDPY